jgi:hypothetical protein
MSLADAHWSLTMLGRMLDTAGRSRLVRLRTGNVRTAFICQRLQVCGTVIVFACTRPWTSKLSRGAC